MKISFDPSKRALTLERRGLDFSAAELVFAERSLTVRNGRRNYGEERFITAGHLKGRCGVLVWTVRDDTRRIISMRYAHADEEAAWFSGLGRPG